MAVFLYSSLRATERVCHSEFCEESPRSFASLRMTLGEIASPSARNDMLETQFAKYYFLLTKSQQREKATIKNCVYDTLPNWSDFHYLV